MPFDIGYQIQSNLAIRNAQLENRCVFFTRNVSVHMNTPRKAARLCKRNDFLAKEVVSVLEVRLYYAVPVVISIVAVAIDALPFTAAVTAAARGIVYSRAALPRHSRVAVPRLDCDHPLQLLDLCGQLRNCRQPGGCHLLCLRSEPSAFRAFCVASTWL